MMGEEVAKSSTSVKVKILPAFMGVAVTVVAVIVFWRRKRRFSGE